MKWFKRRSAAARPLTQHEAFEQEREQRVAAREPVDFSYTVFWTKQARLWSAADRSAVAARLQDLFKSPDFQPNAFERTYTLDGVDGAHAGASLLALQKVLAALNDE